MNYCRLIICHIAVICLLVGMAFAQTPVTVDAFDEQGNNQSQITLRLRITNNTSETLNGVRARYFIRHEMGRILNVSPYYTAGVTISLDTLEEFLAINIDLPQLAPGMFPNSSGISVGINYADYSEIDKTDSLGSYPGTGSFAQADKIPVYVGGSLVAGVSPVGDDKPKIRIVGFQPENTPGKNAWVKIRNVGKHDARLSYLSLRGASGVRLPLESPGVTGNTLAAGDSLIVCAESPCENGMVLQGLSLGNVSELMLEYGTNMIDYVVWGAVGSNVADAVAKDVWHDSADYIRTVEKIHGPSLPYESGSFFRRMYLEGKSSMDWLVFSPSEMDVAEGCLPNSVPFSWNSGVKIVLPPDAPMHFAWVPVPGALSYRLNIFSEDSVQVYQEETGTTYTDVDLPEGTYLWGVESSDRPVGEAAWGAISLRSARFRVSRLAESASYVEAFSLNVEPFAARKDTKLLVPNWGMYADIRGWDRSHVGNPHWDEEESHRCWAVGIQELNRYFGGNLTQDEIKMYGKTFLSNDSIFGAFPLGTNGAGPAEIDVVTLSWALGDVAVVYHDDSISMTMIKKTLKDGLPLYIVRSGHVMVMDAYRVREENEMEVHFLNPHNDGGDEWSIFSYGEIYDYLTYDKPVDVINTNPLVDMDSDQDGLMDYDEVYRFHTDPDFWDSDSDGVADKIEIWSYTMREVPKHLPAKKDSTYNPYNMQNNAQIFGNSKEIYADIDGDLLRAELDKDSDDDGLEDGDEDLNKNGIIDDGESDPFIADENHRPLFVENDVPGDFVLYSIGKLFMNDGSYCENRKGYPNSGDKGCFFASESKTDYYAVSMAARLFQGAVLHSKGGVHIRNNSMLDHVYLYSDINKRPVVNLQNGAAVNSRIDVLEYNWLWSVNNEIEFVDVGLQEKIVRRGESYILTDGDKYKTLKIESGGMLFIDAGEMFVGDLQIESGGLIDFTIPRQKSILHVMGNVIWRGDVQIPNVIGPKKTERKHNIAKGFKMICHGTNPIFIEGFWAGTIFAPNAKLVLGQANKEIYGRFVGNGITVHQYTKLYSVPWNPEKEQAVVYLNKEKK